MRIVTLRKVVSAALLVAALAYMDASPLRADNTDTPEDVIRAGKNANAELATTMVALREAQAIAAHLERDRAFASKVLEAAKKNDREGMAALFKTDAPRSQIKIREIRDFFFDAFLTTDNKKTYRLCVSSKCDCKHPSGQLGCVVFSEF